MGSLSGLRRGRANSIRREIRDRAGDRSGATMAVTPDMRRRCVCRIRRAPRARQSSIKRSAGSREVPFAGCTLLSRGFDPRGGRLAAGLAGRDRSQPAFTGKEGSLRFRLTRRGITAPSAFCDRWLGGSSVTRRRQWLQPDHRFYRGQLAPSVAPRQHDSHSASLSPPARCRWRGGTQPGSTHDHAVQETDDRLLCRPALGIRPSAVAHCLSAELYGAGSQAGSNGNGGRNSESRRRPSHQPG